MLPILIFDYDGTIHNTMRVYEAAFRKCHEQLIADGILEPEEVSYDRISSWLGMNAKEMWLDFHPELPEEVREVASRQVSINQIALVKQHAARWYPGAKEMLDQLKAKGHTMLILSNSRIITAQAHWEEFEMNRWFEKWYDSESFHWVPKSEIVKTIQKEYPGDYIVIGDRASDKEGADSLHCPFIGCSYGYGRPCELNGAQYLADDVSQIPELSYQICSDREGHSA